MKRSNIQTLIRSSLHCQMKNIFGQSEEKIKSITRRIEIMIRIPRLITTLFAAILLLAACGGQPIAEDASEPTETSAVEAIVAPADDEPTTTPAYARWSCVDYRCIDWWWRQPTSGGSDHYGNTHPRSALATFERRSAGSNRFRPRFLAASRE